MRRTQNGQSSRSLGVFALAAAVLLLTACSAAPATNGTNNGSSNPPSLLLNITPTPTFNPVTIGAWTSNQSPQLNDIITLYALIRVQVADMTRPATPPQTPATVTFSFSGGFGGTAVSAQTDTDGLAAYTMAAQGQPAVPVTVTATAAVNGLSLTTYTFYTILPTAPPSVTPTASPSATPGG
jgi:hypothetical protein